MSNLTFISDVIYGLKLEYGESITVGTRSSVQNQATGLKTTTLTTYIISMAIPLVENLRQSFLRSVGIKKEGGLKKGERQFLIDKADVQTPIIAHQCYIEYDGKQAEVTEIEDYKYGLIVTVQAINQPTI